MVGPVGLLGGTRVLQGFLQQALALAGPVKE